MIKELDWTVSKRPLQSIDGDSTDYFGIFRDDTNVCLNAVSDRYTITQNVEVFKLLKHYFKGTKIEGGYFGRGERIYYSIIYDKLFKNTAMEMDRRIIVADSHDGSVSLRIGLQEYVQVCSNGMMSWTNKGQVKFKHTKSISEKIKDFDRYYKIFENFAFKRKELYENFKSTTVTKELVREVISKLNNVDSILLDEGFYKFTKKYSTQKYNTISAQLSSIEEEMNRHGKNKFALFMGVTNYTTHKIKNDDVNESLMFRIGYNINNKALKLIEVL